MKNHHSRFINSDILIKKSDALLKVKENEWI